MGNRVQLTKPPLANERAARGGRSRCDALAGSVAVEYVVLSLVDGSNSPLHALSSERAVGASAAGRSPSFVDCIALCLVLSASGTVAGDVSLGPAADGDDARERAAPVESEPAVESVTAGV